MLGPFFDWGLRGFDRQFFGIFRRAETFHRAEQTIRATRAANERTQFHHGGNEFVSAFRRQQLFQLTAHLGQTFGSVDWCTHIEQPRHHADDIGIEHRHWFVEGESPHRLGRVVPDPRKTSQSVVVPRKHSAHIPPNFCRGRVQISCAAVVAETLPQGQHFGFLGGGKFMHRRKPLHPSLVIRNDRCHRRLLQHHLTHENRVRIPRPTPRQIASVLAEPRA